MTKSFGRSSANTFGFVIAMNGAFVVASLAGLGVIGAMAIVGMVFPGVTWQRSSTR